MLILPDSKTPQSRKLLVSAIDSLTSAGERVRNPRLCQWLISEAYLQGCRVFQGVNYLSGEVKEFWPNVGEGEELPFRNDEALRHMQIETGRFLSIDIRPSVTMRGWGLDRLRAAGIGQVVLDYQIDDTMLSRIRHPYVEQFLTTGFFAGMASVKDAGELSAKSRIELVKPHELLPIPYNAKHPHLATGIIRTRWVPLEWIRRHAEVWDKIKKIAAEDLEVVEFDWADLEASGDDSYGDMVASSALKSISNAFRSSFSKALNGAFGEQYVKHKEGRQLVRVSEVWLKNDDGLVRRYVLKIGRTVVADVDFEKTGSSVWFPLGISRYYGVGFYGRSFVEGLIPFTDMSEKILARTMENLRNLDSMGILALPADLGIDDESFRDDVYPRRLYYEPDPMLPERGPTQIRPHNIGTLHQQAAGLVNQFTQTMAGQSALFTGQSLGRIDSQAGMGFVLEQNNVGIEAPGSGLADAFSTIYAAILASSKQTMDVGMLHNVLTLDTNVVGVVVGPDGSVDLSKNPIPSPTEVKINIKSRTPPSPTQQLGELRTNLQMQLITPLQFRLSVYRKGLPTDVSNEGEYQSWRKIRHNIRTLFNDGTTPQRELVAVNPLADNLEVCLEELTAFMATVEFSLASEDVKNAFGEVREMYESLKTGRIPEQLPSMEDAASGVMFGQGGGQPQMMG